MQGKATDLTPLPLCLEQNTSFMTPSAAGIMVVSARGSLVQLETDAVKRTESFQPCCFFAPLRGRIFRQPLALFSDLIIEVELFIQMGRV